MLSLAEICRIVEAKARLLEERDHRRRAERKLEHKLPILLSEEIVRRAEIEAAHAAHEFTWYAAWLCTLSHPFTKS